MWMEERMGRKVNIERTDEALASASNTLAVGCPFCNIMLSDGIAERNADSEMEVQDIAELLLRAVAPAREDPSDRTTQDAGIANS